MYIGFGWMYRGLHGMSIEHNDGTYPTEVIPTPRVKKEEGKKRT